MNGADLITKIQLNTLLQTTDSDYTSAVLYTEINDALTTKFEGPILDMRGGFWLQYQDTLLAAGQDRVRIPFRALKLSKVEIGTGAAGAISFNRLPECPEGQADIFQPPQGQTGAPQRMIIRDDQIMLQPPADNSGYTLRVWYYLRPSRITDPQNAEVYQGVLSGGTQRGRVSAINLATRALTVNALPFDQLLVTPIAITSAVQLVDVVHPNGWYSLPVVGATQSIAGTVITLTDTQDMSEIQIGDYVRVAEQTDWPPIPIDFHRCLADVTSIKILTQQHDFDKAGSLAGDVSGDLGRFAQIIAKRVQEEPIVLRAELPSLRRSRF